MNNKIICAIDTSDLKKAELLIIKLKEAGIYAIKLGLEFFLRNGYEGVNKISALDVPIFLDLKLHDIPNTVSGAVSIMSDLNIYMTTVHVSGGVEMMKAAKDALKNVDAKIVGVTCLTSLSHEDIGSIFYPKPDFSTLGYERFPGDIYSKRKEYEILRDFQLKNSDIPEKDKEKIRYYQYKHGKTVPIPREYKEKYGFSVPYIQKVNEQLGRLNIERYIENQKKYIFINMAVLAKHSGLDGIVCSALDISIIQKNLEDPFTGESILQKDGEFVFVTPGIRPAGAKKHDQSRVVTPQEAIKMGSDYLVIGRPITAASDPAKALQDILNALPK